MSSQGSPSSQDLFICASEGDVMPHSTPQGVSIEEIRSSSESDNLSDNQLFQGSRGVKRKHSLEEESDYDDLDDDDDDDDGVDDDDDDSDCDEEYGFVADNECIIIDDDDDDVDEEENGEEENEVNERSDSEDEDVKIDLISSNGTNKKPFSGQIVLDD